MKISWTELEANWIWLYSNSQNFKYGNKFTQKSMMVLEEVGRISVGNILQNSISPVLVE